MSDDDDEKKELKRVQFLFNLISDRYNDEIARRTNLDGKASNIIIFVGILISLESSFGTFLLKEISKTTAYYSSYINAFVISLIFLLASLGCGLYAYRVQKWDVVPETSQLITYYETNVDKIDIMTQVMGSKSDVITKNKDAIEEKSEFVKYGLIFLVIGMLSILIFIISLLYTYPSLIQH